MYVHCTHCTHNRKIMYPISKMYNLVGKRDRDVVQLCKYIVVLFTQYQINIGSRFLEGLKSKL